MEAVAGVSASTDIELGAWRAMVVPSHCGQETPYVCTTCSEERPMAQPVPGTTIFDGVEAQKGYALNKMCYSFNEAANRRACLEDEEGYCARFGLTERQRRAVKDRDV